MNLTIGGLVDSCVRARPHGAAATLGPDLVTFSDLDRAADRATRALLSLGVGGGDIVLWLADPTLRTLSVFLACARAGAVFAPVNPQLPAAELAGVADYLDPRLILTDRAHAEDLDTRPVAVTGAAGRAVPGVDFDARCADCPDTPPGVPVDDRAPHIVYLTSGSTGRPKGALVSHRASWLRASAGGGTFTRGLRGDGGVVSAFPLYHYGGWHYVLEAWQNRRPIHLVHRASAEQLLAAVERGRASALYAIPAVWDRILDAELPADLSSLRHADTGTSHTSAELLSRIRARVPQAGTTVLYGSTEVGRMAALYDDEITARPGSVGRPAAPGTLWVDEGSGEVCAASPTMMDGYLRLPEQTAAVLRDGVYRSGDVGYVDADGYLYLTGRVGDRIRTGGETVWPVEVEDALRGTAGVTDLAVVGVPDDRWGELVCAAVVPAQDCAPPTVDALAAHLAGRLARFKLPRLVAAVPAIPRTAATGQVQRAVLREMVTSTLR